MSTFLSFLSFPSHQFHVLIPLDSNLLLSSIEPLLVLDNDCCVDKCISNLGATCLQVSIIKGSATMIPVAPVFLIQLNNFQTFNILVMSDIIVVTYILHYIDLHQRL